MVNRNRNFVGTACIASALALLSVQVALAGPRLANDKKALGTSIVLESDVAVDGPVSHGPGTLVTGFESPFTVGQIDTVVGGVGQQGWNASNALAVFPSVVISNATPDTGTQHLRITDATGIADGTLTGAFSPALVVPTSGPSVFECRIKISNDGGADYHLIGQAPSQGFLKWRVVFSFSGDAGTEQGTIYVRDDIGAGGFFANTGVLWTENAYKTFRVEYAPNGEIKYFYDGALIYTDINEANTSPATKIEQVVMVSDNFQSAGETFDVDGFSLTPSTATTGACCEPDGDCTETTPAACVAPNNFRGLATTCNAGTCVGKCCQPDGFCSTVSADACSGAGFVFGGFLTACNPLTPAECLGRCCLPDGGCIDDGPQPCVANGGTFGGVGVACGDGSQCVGRCCVGANTCIPGSSPNACAVAGGTLTLGGICQATNEFNFVTSLAIPDGPAGGGVGTPVTNVQNIAGQTGTISDLNVDIKVTHTWVGDLVIDITHGATTVTVVDLMGQLTAAGGGCGSDNLNIILDDEGTGGAIEDQCQAAAAAAVSPPNYTPANPLSAFDGMDPNGAWTITLRDTFQADVGTLTGWSLHFQSGANPCTPSCSCKGDLNGSGTVNGADINKFAQCVASGGGAGCACADINGGGINAADVTPFVNALIAGTACIP